MAHPAILKVAHNALGVLLQHRHVIAGRLRLTSLGLGSDEQSLAHLLLQVRVEPLFSG
jgi:hypothetical protein